MEAPAPRRPFRGAASALGCLDSMSMPMSGHFWPQCNPDAGNDVTRNL